MLLIYICTVFQSLFPSDQAKFVSVYLYQSMIGVTALKIGWLNGPDDHKSRVILQALFVTSIGWEVQ